MDYLGVKTLKGNFDIFEACEAARILSEVFSDHLATYTCTLGA